MKLWTINRSESCKLACLKSLKHTSKAKSDHPNDLQQVVNVHSGENCNSSIFDLGKWNVFNEAKLAWKQIAF